MGVREWGLRARDWGGSESAEGGIYTGARRALTSPAQRYYITTLGRQALKLSGRLQPVPDRTLAAQGHQARRLPQPSRPRGRVNLREYSGPQ